MDGRSPPPLSIVLPTLNEAVELPATLRAVRSTFGGKAEIIVADGGSDDGTVEIATAEARVVRSAAGRGRQLNAGAAVATAPTLLFLHADTHPAEGARKSLEKSLTDGAVVGGCFELALRGPTADRPIARILTAAINLRTRLLRTATGDQGIFVRRTTFEEIGGFANHDLFEDVLFFRRLRRRGKVVVVRPPVRTSDRRWREHGYLRTILIHWSLRLLFALGLPPRKLSALYRDRR